MSRAQSPRVGCADTRTRGQNLRRWRATRMHTSSAIVGASWALVHTGHQSQQSPKIGNGSVRCDGHGGDGARRSCRARYLSNSAISAMPPALSATGPKASVARIVPHACPLRRWRGLFLIAKTSRTDGQGFCVGVCGTDLAGLSGGLQVDANLDIIAISSAEVRYLHRVRHLVRLQAHHLECSEVAHQLGQRHHPGLGISMLSTIAPMVVIAIAVLEGYELAGDYGNLDCWRRPESQTQCAMWLRCGEVFSL